MCLGTTHYFLPRSRAGGGGGGNHVVFRGNGGRISRCKQIIKRRLLNIDCQLTANAGEGHKNIIYY